MGRIHDALDDALRRWIGQQHLFFVASAPDDPHGHINLSPKGGWSFHVLGPITAAYVDLLGRGIESVAHLRQNGRNVLMFCAFEGPPKIVRLHDRGRVVPADDPEFGRLIAAFPPNDEIRAIARGMVVVEVDRIADSATSSCRAWTSPPTANNSSTGPRPSRRSAAPAGTATTCAPRTWRAATTWPGSPYRNKPLRPEWSPAAAPRT